MHVRKNHRYSDLIVGANWFPCVKTPSLIPIYVITGNDPNRTSTLEARRKSYDVDSVSLDAHRTSYDVHRTSHDAHRIPHTE